MPHLAKCLVDEAHGSRGGQGHTHAGGAQGIERLGHARIHDLAVVALAVLDRPVLVDALGSLGRGGLDAVAGEDVPNRALERLVRGAHLCEELLLGDVEPIGMRERPELTEIEGLGVHEHTVHVKDDGVEAASVVRLGHERSLLRNVAAPAGTATWLTWVVGATSCAHDSRR